MHNKIGTKKRFLHLQLEDLRYFLGTRTVEAEKEYSDAVVVRNNNAFDDTVRIFEASGDDAWQKNERDRP